MVRYRLDDLGAIQFEWLCQALLKKACGLAVESWGGHSDRGNDAWSVESIVISKPRIRIPGPVTFQVKFVSNANAVGSRSLPALKKAVSAEISHLKQRNRQLSKIEGGYILLTNVPLSAEGRSLISKQLQSALPQRKILILGANDICDLLNDAPGIRVSFPQLLGLGDLRALIESAVDRHILNRSTLARERAEELAPVFFPTQAYRDALEKLEQHHFVVLTGPPEMGKTTIARMIGLAKMSEGWRCLECSEPGEVITHIRERDTSTLFIADDAFGTTEYKPSNAFAWARELDAILRAVDNKHWLIWTSRPAPLKLALEKMHLQGKAEKFPSPSEIVVDAAELSYAEKVFILFRHAKNAGLAEDAKILLKDHASEIVQNEHFTPERVRRFILDSLPSMQGKSAASISKMIASTVETPTESMSKSFRALDSDHQALLIAMLDAGSGEVTQEQLVETLRRHNDGFADVATAIDNLESHFLKRRKSRYW